MICACYAGLLLLNDRLSDRDACRGAKALPGFVERRINQRVPSLKNWMEKKTCLSSQVRGAVRFYHKTPGAFVRVFL